MSYETDKNYDRLLSNRPAPPATMLEIRIFAWASGYRAALEDMREGRVTLDGHLDEDVPAGTLSRELVDDPDSSSGKRVRETWMPDPAMRQAPGITMAEKPPGI